MHSPLVNYLRTIENIGRALIKIKWEARGKSDLLSDHIGSYDTR
jgi:hypothetical protein